MQYHLIMCRSLTYAQRAAAALERAGVTAPIARAPQELNTEGCGYCVKVASRRFQDSIRILHKAKVPHGRLFRSEPDGGYTEVLG